MTKEEWFKLKPGQFIYSSKIPREIIKVSNKNINTRCITLKALRKTKYGPNTVYCANDCYKWSLEPKSDNRHDR